MITRLPQPATEYRPIRAPRGHGEVVVEPPWPRVGSLLDENRRRGAAQDGDLLGVSWRQLRRRAREALLQAAYQHTRVYRDVAALRSESQPILLAGHQPQLFHAGVWFKNFALSALGNTFGAHAVNLVIDNDIQRAPVLRVPAGQPQARHLVTVPFDRLTEAVPYEERTIQDSALFDAFGHRVMEAIGPLVPEALIADWWPLAVESSRRTTNLGGCLAEARHQLEGRWGQQTLELPLSVVCQSEEFACFTAHLLAHLPRLQEIYNLSLAEYRRVNHVRSRSHPVPDLAADGQWLEAPFWIWSREQPHRRRLFVRAWGEGLELTDRAGWSCPLSVSADGQAEPAVEQLCALSRQGIKLRPRALVTTMYARLVLGDLFLHGIGGAKYDQLTDLIIQRFFGLTPPHYLTLSATALLLEDRCGEMRDEVRKTRDLLRELRYHPERHVAPSTAAQRWCAEKAAQLVSDPPRGQRKQRHQAIQRSNAALQAHLSVAPESLGRQLEEQTAALRHAALFASREFAFCLFPENILRPLLLALSTAAL